MSTVNFSELVKQAGTAATTGGNYAPLRDGDY